VIKNVELEESKELRGKLDYATQALKLDFENGTNTGFEKVKIRLAEKKAKAISYSRRRGSSSDEDQYQNTAYASR
jgi:hypothetical protein